MDDHEKSDETCEQDEIGEKEAGDENEIGGNGTGQKVAKAAGMVAGVTTGAATVASVSAGGAFAVPGMGMGVATGAAGVTTGSALASGAVIGTGGGRRRARVRSSACMSSGWGGRVIAWAVGLRAVLVRLG